MVNANKQETNKSKIDFPMLELEEALKITKKALHGYADIMPYEHLALISTGKKITKGGRFGLVSKSLKLYNLMERYSKTEIKVTEFGKKLSNMNDEREIKKLLFKSFVGVLIFNEIYSRYSVLPKRKALTDYIINKGVEKREAGRLVGVYIRNYEYLELNNNQKDYSEKEDKETIKEEYKEEEKDKPIEFDKKFYGVMLGAGSLFGEDIKDKKKEVQNLLDLSKEYNLIQFGGLLNAIILLNKDKSEEEFQKELKKISKEALKLLKQDLGLSQNHIQSD